MKETILPALPCLENVDLSACYMLGDSTIEELVIGHNRGGKLKKLNISKCFGISGQSLKYIGKYCSALTELNIGEGCGAAQDEGLIFLLQKNPTSANPNHEKFLNPIVYTLEKLYINGCDFVSQSYLAHFLSVLTCVCFNINYHT